MNGLFNTPVRYKNILIYPATLNDDYDLIEKCCNLLTINQQLEKQKSLLVLPFLQYLLQSKKDSETDIVPMLQYILSISFQNCDIGFTEKGVNIFYKTQFYQTYYKQLIALYIQREQNKDNKAKEQINQEIDKLQNKIYNIKTITNDDFLQIKDIICQINGFKTTVLAPSLENELIVEQNNIAEKQKGLLVDKTQITTDELIMGVAFYLHKTPQELKDLSILAFRYYLQLMFATEAYVQGRAAQIETKFWLQPYKPKDKYDGLLTQMDMQKMKIK